MLTRQFYAINYAVLCNLFLVLTKLFSSIKAQFFSIFIYVLDFKVNGYLRKNILLILETISVLRNN